jgi:competence protein ComEC
MAGALVAGVRAGIDQATWRAMQVSGLAHILSVSGLHMVLVAGSVFAGCRWVLALCPPLALRVPVKKIAAVLTALAAALYLVLSGATVPTQRSFLMTAVALLAAVVDRNRFSLRLLAWAALVVLVLRPESILGGSFQLSFGSVLALMVVYKAGTGAPAIASRPSQAPATRRGATLSASRSPPWWRVRPRHPWPRSISRRSRPVASSPTCWPCHSPASW